MLYRTPVPQDLRETYAWCSQCCQEICGRKAAEPGDKTRCLGQVCYNSAGGEIRRHLIDLVYLSLPLPHSSTKKPQTSQPAVDCPHVQC